MAEQQPDPGWCSCGKAVDETEMHAWVVRSRRAQGLPDHLEDPAVLDKLAALVLEAEGRRDP